MPPAPIKTPAVLRSRPVLVTGGAGFIGSNLADRLATMGRDVLVLDSFARPGVAANVTWLKRRHPARISVMAADIRDSAAVAEAVRDAEAIFHFAAQVAVTTSLVSPREDFDVNAGGTLLLLDALRRRRQPILFASTNKVYGDLADVDLVVEGGRYVPRNPALRAHGIGESRPLDFHTPYGCSKGAADQYVLDFARSYGIPAVALRMSCIYGPRQRGTEDQGWVAHFIRRALARRNITLYGDGLQVRDILHVEDAVSAYLAAWDRAQDLAGQAFNLGGGPRNAVSLLQVLAEIEKLLGRKIPLNFEPWRAGDQRYFVADTRRAAAALGLKAPRDWRSGLADLASWLQSDEAADSPIELAPIVAPARIARAGAA